MGTLKPVRQSTMCLSVLRKFLTFDGQLAACEAGTISPNSGRLTIETEKLKEITLRHSLRKAKRAR